jgi:PBP1b-binding outer membrane lipoprotein LpoB
MTRTSKVTIAAAVGAAALVITGCSKTVVEKESTQPKVVERNTVIERDRAPTTVERHESTTIER